MITKRNWAVLCAVVCGMCAASTTYAIDVRDYLPNGNVFELTNLSEDLDVNWDDAAEEMDVVIGAYSFEAATWMNENVTLTFVATGSFGSGISYVQGTIELLTTGDLFLLVDVYRTDSSWEGARALHQDGQTVTPGLCDCENEVTTGCTTNKRLSQNSLNDR